MGNWERVHSLLHPYLRRIDSSGKSARGRTNVMSRLREAPPIAAPRSYELRAGQIYRWVDNRTRPPQVFIAEESDYDESLGQEVWTARFFVHFEGSDGSFCKGPDLVSAEDAIDWGRRQADIVQIRVGNRYYQAGVRPHPDCASGPRWPPLLPVHRRPAGDDHELP